MKVTEGIYFLHISFLREVASNGITAANAVSKQLQILMSLVFHDPCLSIKIISCDRTMTEMAKPKNKVGFTPGILSLIDEKSYIDGKLTDDEYALKIASREKISSLPNFFLVAESEKSKISNLSKSLGYKMNVISTEDIE